MLTRRLKVLLVNIREPVYTKYSTTSILNNLNPTATPTTKSSQQASKPARLFAAVCIERLPVITSDMNDLEKRYSNLINEINVRKSYLSNHELRHLKDLERAAKKKTAAEQGDTEEFVIETAIDYEEKCLKELKKLSFGERKLSTEFDASVKEKSKENIKSLFQNIDYILDKKLILLVNDPITSIWQLPYAEWTAADPSLRNVAERTVSNLNDKLVVDFMGNAPVGIYKTTNSTTNTVDKFYFFKAQYKAGAQALPASSKFDFVWIRKDELKDFVKNKEYLDCLNSFILDF